MSRDDDDDRRKDVSIASTSVNGWVEMSESEETTPSTEADETDRGDEVAAAERALNDLPDGSGCAEIWDYLSERRRQD